MSVASEVAKRLLQIKAIKLNPQNPFTWASGIKSPIYCDNRIILSHPNIRDYVIYCLEKKATSMPEFDVVAGVATAGIAFGALLADRLKKPMVYVRSKAKEHGRQNMIEGQLEGTERILVIEDLISTGGSSLKAVEALKETGCEVVGVHAIFSYGFDKATTAFASSNCPFGTLTNYQELLQEAVKSDYIKEEQLVSLSKWSESPADWFNS
ncbi:orotate phosphoribosyltransferase [Saprospiraceae bacterium]|nr:orotate phosphoribosyltransferase [Saprospiraceae bacterium]MDG1433062.1 orotate phosphoribosyltransferase [Saprospiraceae bacterium]